MILSKEFLKDLKVLLEKHSIAIEFDPYQGNTENKISGIITITEAK